MRRVDRLSALEHLATGRTQRRSQSERAELVSNAVARMHRAYLAGENMDAFTRALVPDDDVSPGTIGERRLAAVCAMAKTVIHLENTI